MAGWGGGAGQTQSGIQMGKLRPDRERGIPEPTGCKGPSAVGPASRQGQGSQPGLRSVYSHGQAAGDREAVAPLQGPVLPPLSACDGAGRLLRGDPVPGVREDRVSGTPSPSHIKGWHTQHGGLSEHWFKSAGRSELAWRCQALHSFPVPAPPRQTCLCPFALAVLHFTNPPLPPKSSLP